MKFDRIREWLARWEAIDDSIVAAGGTPLEELRQDAEARTVSPAVLAEAPSELGKVVRYVRELRGWTRHDIAARADIEEQDVVKIETVVGYDPGPRTLVKLADTCGFSRKRFQILAQHVVPSRLSGERNAREVAFAARSKGLSSISDDELETIRALVEVLREKTD